MTQLGQIPVSQDMPLGDGSGNPTGTASGDLGGSFPNPSVVGEVGSGAGTGLEWTGNARMTAPFYRPQTINGFALKRRWMRTTASDGNPRRLILFYKTRDSSNWEASTPVEIIVYSNYFQPSMTRSYFTSGWNNTNNGAPIITTVDAIGGQAMVPILLGGEVNVSGTIYYQGVSLDLPAYVQVTVEMTYGESAEVGSVAAFTGSAQIYCAATEQSLTGSGASQVQPSGPGTGRFAPGDLKASAVPSAPLGWLLCDGSAVSRTTYAALFNAISTTYGAGNGSTTFNLPDLRGRVPVGAGIGTAASASSWALGNQPTSGAGGEEQHTLTNGEMPQHSHSGSTSGVTSQAASTNPAWDFSSSGTSRVVSLPASGAGTANFYNSHTHSISQDGGGLSHNNMQPVSVVNYFIKT